MALLDGVRNSRLMIDSSDGTAGNYLGLMTGHNLEFSATETEVAVGDSDFSDTVIGVGRYTFTVDLRFDDKAKSTWDAAISDPSKERTVDFQTRAGGQGWTGEMKIIRSNAQFDAANKRWTGQMVLVSGTAGLVFRSS